MTQVLFARVQHRDVEYIDGSNLENVMSVTLCIPFTITVDGVEYQYEAVGVLTYFKKSIKREEAFRRAGDQVLQNWEDWMRIRENWAQIKDKVSGYCLYTACPCDKDAPRAMFLNAGGEAWCNELWGECGRTDLVVRHRLASDG